MSQPVLSVLQEKGAVSSIKEPMEPAQYDLRSGVPIIDIPRGTRGTTSDFIIYDNVTSPDGRVLIQGTGRAYHGIVVNGEIRFEVQKIGSNLPFGVIGRYPDDYYLANREFVSDLESRLG
ncbi:MAG TPA: hypothetical protein VJJ52_07565 [Candidatus Nanoarchaeia archaeon]|nr:hypothetical protein [Candidatus Nanoarchaeia archaeon]